MSRYAGNAETRTLFQRHAFWELNDLFQRNRSELNRTSEWSIGLSAITPTRRPIQSRGTPSPTASTVPEPIAVRNDTRIGHPDTKCVVALFDIARIYT
jgi:hypothetical protein